jgi:hypothetical protein
MSNLTRANRELFSRGPDERFESVSALWQHCQQQHEQSQERWHPPEAIKTVAENGRLKLALGGDGAFDLNDWSFSQVCRLAGVSKDTVNRLSPQTAGAVFFETLPDHGKPLQALTKDRVLRSIHGASYTRLNNLDLLRLVGEFATDFEPPQAAAEGGTGLYCGEQDMFVFLIDPTGWTEINGEAFAPGFFLWNSEVGRRSVGIQTFWFQAVCQNHIVWDAIEVAEFSRKHTANVHDALSEIRQRIETLVTRRDERREGFVHTIRAAMETRLGDSADAALEELHKRGFRRALATEALKIAQDTGGFTVFSIVDALTRISGQLTNAGERVEADAKAGALLAAVS